MIFRAGRAAAQLLCGAAIAVSSFASHAAPELGVYRYDAPQGGANIQAYSDWLGKPVTLATAFEGRATWDDIDGAAWQLEYWGPWTRAQPGRNISLAVPLLPSSGGVSLSSCAAGQYDVYWRNLANNLTYYGLHWAYLRLGWEMDGAWFAWNAPPGSGKEAAFAGCFRRVVQVMRQAQPANQWKFVLNTAAGWQNKSYLEAVWPGDAYVDVVAIDLYDQSWAPNTYPYPSPCDTSCRLTRQQNAWNDYAPKLYAMRDFAIARGKKIALPEWGVGTRPDGHGGGENPEFLRKMYNFIHDPANNVAFHSYWDVVAHDFDSKLSPTTHFPESSSVYKQLFGSTSTTTSGTDSGPTSVTFTAPAEGATISGSFSNSSVCEVTGTGISRVVFFMDTTQLNTESAAPWNCSVDTWQFANGTHMLKAVAYNSVGASTTVTRNVNVQNGPSVAFVAPAANATISGSFSNSSACEATGTGISRVVFFMDTTQLNTENAAPWNCTVDTRLFANGTHTLRAVAYDAAGASASTQIPVNVQNTVASPADSIPPTIYVTSPSMGTAIQRRSTVSLDAAASDNVGVAAVEFFVNDAPVCLVKAPPYSCTWNTGNKFVRSYTIKAKAIDAAGNAGLWSGTYQSSK